RAHRKDVRADSWRCGALCHHLPVIMPLMPRQGIGNGEHRCGEQKGAKWAPAHESGDEVSAWCWSSRGEELVPWLLPVIAFRVHQRVMYFQNRVLTLRSSFPHYDRLY